ncbi:class I SAM-dependent methyltransferase [Saccharothrix xinjiangensis]|uniref:Class I SAM-dependent methyltransferase n=1 Tax=Saccharothrix xinjiangensis TaxID=204798 RepID=A0ABV9YH46_9PSEU
MSGTPSSTWYVDFFTELPNEFWRRAVPPEVTVEEIDFVEERLDLAPRSLVLDVPCGSGRHSLELARRGHRVTGVDLSAEAIGHARRAATDLDVDFTSAADLRVERRLPGRCCPATAVHDDR